MGCGDYDSASSVSSKEQRRRKRKAIVKIEQNVFDIEFGGVKTFKAWTKGREVFVEARADVARKS